MKSRAKVLVCFAVTVACAGTSGPVTAEEARPKDRSAIPTYGSTKDARRFAPYILQPKAAPRQDLVPTHEHYEECAKDCNRIVFTVAFDGSCPKSVGLEEHWKLCKRLKGHSDEEWKEYRDTCTATRRGLTIVFAKTDDESKTYKVRFAPFGEPITVSSTADLDLRISEEAARAWYKFTVYSAGNIQGCEPIDPNVIVTN